MGARFSRADAAWWALIVASVVFGDLEGIAPRLPPDNVAVLWIPNAVLTVALIRRAGQWPNAAAMLAVFMLGFLARGLILSDPIPVQLAFGAADAIEAIVIAAVMAWIFGPGLQLDRPLEPVIGAVMILAAPALSATIAPYLVGWAGSPALIDFSFRSSAFTNWVLGNAMGYLTVGAVLAAVTGASRGRWLELAARRWLEGLVAFVALVAAVVAGFLGPQLVFGPEASAGYAGFLFLATPAFVWAAFRFGPPAAAIALSAGAAPAIWLTALGYGPFANGALPSNVNELQLLLIAIGATSFLVAALADQSRTAREAAADANAAKGRFLSAAAHELRTPLNGVLGAADLLLHEFDEDDPKRDRAEMIARSARLLAYIVDDLVTYASVGPAADRNREAQMKGVQEPELAYAEAATGRILVAEDNVTNRLLFEAMLGALGFQTDVVENGAQAVAAVGSRQFDAVLMDLQMPVMDGEEAIRRIRAMKGAAANTPIIVVTAQAVPGDEERLRELGADGFVPKPVEASKLVQALEPAFARAAAAEA